jgi:ethanolamine utilization protein EutA
MHDIDEEHDHPEGEGEEIEGLEKFTLRSVGIDIGSSTTHLVFSRLVLRRQGAALSTRFSVTERAILYRSPILLTPYLSGTLIDTEQVAEFVYRAYREAGFTQQDVDTGAVIITGEALKKENARPIAELFAKEGGRFICVSAGPNHEALLAAHGCGAVAFSRSQKATVLNIDIGGGTSKLSVIRDGVVTSTAAVNVGARLVVFDEAGVLKRIEAPAQILGEHLGFSLALGMVLTPKEQADLAALMTRVLFEVVQGGHLSPLAQSLMLTDPLRDHPGLEHFSYVVFSGGVSEYIYSRERAAYGDLGLLLGSFVKRGWDQLAPQVQVWEPAEGIRATVIGAGEYTVQASGNTSYISNPGVLPAFGLKVVRVLMDRDGPPEEPVRQALAKVDLPSFTSGLAVAITLKGVPDYPSLKRVAHGLAQTLHGADPGFPLFLVLNLDVAKSLGGILKEEMKVAQEVIAVDGIDVGDLDYLDIGRNMGVSEVLPVTVKSLVFPSSR